MKNLTPMDLRDVLRVIIDSITQEIVKTLGYNPNSLSEDEFYNCFRYFVTFTKDNKSFKVEGKKSDLECYSKKNLDNLERAIRNKVFALRNISDPYLIAEEISQSFNELYKWKASYKDRQKTLETIKLNHKIDREFKSSKELSLEKEIIKLKETIKKLQIENKEGRNDIENLNKNNLAKKSIFSNSQIQAIKKMNAHGISIRLIAMEFNCTIEDVKNVID